MQSSRNRHASCETPLPGVAESACNSLSHSAAMAVKDTAHLRCVGRVGDTHPILPSRSAQSPLPPNCWSWLDTSMLQQCSRCATGSETTNKRTKQHCSNSLPIRRRQVQLQLHAGACPAQIMRMPKHAWHLNHTAPRLSPLNSWHLGCVCAVCAASPAPFCPGSWSSMVCRFPLLSPRQAQPRTSKSPGCTTHSRGLHTP